MYKRPTKINPDKNNRNWHEHLCLPYRLGKKMFKGFCPYLDEGARPEFGDDCCDHCPYNVLMYYDEESGLLQVHGDVNVFHLSYDFTSGY